MWTAQCQGHLQRQRRPEHKAHTRSPRRDFKISDPVGNRTRAAMLECRDSTDRATVTDSGGFLTYQNTEHIEDISSVISELNFS